jgi:hypothetical protein
MRFGGQVGRWARWLFALVVFIYLWREGGFWRYVAAGGFTLMLGLAALLAIADRRHRK